MSTHKPAVFAGIQKLTLLDYPEKTACTLFTAGCNFACPYCQNPELVKQSGEAATKPQGLSEQEILEFLNTRRGLLDGVCISGGEPLIHEGIFDFSGKVKEMGFLVKVDTNGSYPDRLIQMVQSSVVDYVAMDVKNSPEKYAKTIGISEYETASIDDSIKYLLTGAVPYEFRTTVVRDFHTVDDLVAIAKWIAGADRYFLQGFENCDKALKPGLAAYSEPELLQMCEQVREILPCTQIRSLR